MADMDITSGVIADAATSITADSIGMAGAYVVVGSAAHTGITVNFEGTVNGGASWFALGAYLVSGAFTAVVTSAVLGSNTTTQYFVIVGAAQKVRVRSSAYSTGSLGVTIMTSEDGAPNTGL